MVSVTFTDTQLQACFEYNLAALVGKELVRKKAEPSYAVGIEGFAGYTTPDTRHGATLWTRCLPAGQRLARWQTWWLWNAGLETWITQLQRSNWTSELSRRSWQASTTHPGLPPG